MRPLPANLAGAWWAEFALVTVSLGLVDSWVPSGVEWDGAEWDSAVWGESYLTPSAWLDVTADVQSLDLDTGRNGVDDPGDVATATCVLFDPLGTYAIAGSDRSALGNLFRVEVEWRRRDRSLCLCRQGRRREGARRPRGAGDLRARGRPARGPAHDRRRRRAPRAKRDRATRVPARPRRRAGRTPRPRRRLDLATRGRTSGLEDRTRLEGPRRVRSAARSWRWATGRFAIDSGRLCTSPSAPVALEVGTVPGAICPSALDLSEAGADIVNVYDWTTADRDAPLRATASDPESIRRHGRCASVRTDLLNTDQSELESLVDEELARSAWSPERADVLDPDT